MLKSVNGFILAKYCRWSHTDKKKEKKKRMSLFLSFSMYICVMMTIADVFVGSVFVVYSPCHTFMTSKKKNIDAITWHFIISLSPSVKFTF